MTAVLDGAIRPLAEVRRVLTNLYYGDWFYCKRVVPSVKDITSLTFWADKKIVDGLVNGVGWLGRKLAWLAGLADRHGVDGAVRGSARLSLAGGNLFRGMVTGRIQDYVKFTVIGMGVVLILAILSS